LGILSGGLLAVEGICNAVYQARIFDAAAYKTGMGGLHSHGAMGTDAAGQRLAAAEQTNSLSSNGESS
jgi:hypothetical protein